MTYIPPLNGGRINATISGNTAGAGSLVSTGTMTLAGGNNITLSQAGNAITISGASNAAQSNQTLGLYAVGNTTQNSSTTRDARSLSFNGLGGATVGYSNGSVQLSVPSMSGIAVTGILSASTNGSTVSIGAPAFSAGISNIGNSLGTSGTFSNQVVLAGGNNITLSQGTDSNGATITVSGAAQSNQVMSLSALGNTTQTSTGTLNASRMNLSGAGIVSIGYPSGASAVISATQSNQAFSAQGGSSAFQTLSFSNANGMTFSNNAGQVVGSYTVPTVTNSSMTMQAGASTLSSVSRVAFGDGNGISFGASTSNNGSITITGTVATNYAASNHSHGNPTLNLTNLSGTTGSASNGLTLSLSAANPGLTTARASNDAIGLNTAGTNVTWTANSSGLSFNGAGYAGTGFSGTNASGTMNSNGLSLSVGAGGGVGISNSQTSYNSGTVKLLEGGGAITINSTTGSAFQFNVPATSSLVGVNGITVSTNGSTISISGGGGGGGGGGTLSLTATGANTTQNSTGSMNATNIMVSGGGGVSMGFSSNTMYVSGPGASSLSATGAVSISSNANTISIGAPYFLAGISNLGNTLGTSSTVASQTRLVLAGGNNITLSQVTGAGGATVSVAGGAGGGGGGVALYDGTNSISSGTVSIVDGGALTASITGQTLSLNAPAVSSLVGTNGISISTAGSTITIDGAGAGGGGGGGGTTLSRWEYPNQVFAILNTAHTSSMSFQHMYVPFNVTGSAMKMAFSVSVSTFTSATTASANLSLYLGIYTLNGSTLSRATSASATQGLSWLNTASATSYNSLLNGVRQISVPMTVSMSAGEYWVGALYRAGTTYTTLAASVMGDNQIHTTGNLYDFGANSASSSNGRDVFLGQGILATTSHPASVALSAISNSGASYAMRAAFYNAIYNATY